MMSDVRIGRYALAWVALIALVACSGGGGGNSAPVPIVTPSPTANPSTDPCESIADRAAGRHRAPRAHGGVVPDRVYVTYRSSAATRGTSSSIERSVGSTRSVDLGVQLGQSRRIVMLPAGLDPDSAAAKLKANPDVVDVAPMHYRSLASVPAAGADAVNDPRSNSVEQWYLYITGVNPAAWNVTHGSSAVSVAVIDTGLDVTNTDLTAKLDYSEKVLNGVTTVGQAAIQDSNGHGTNVAGLATAATNNSYGYAGVGYDTHLQFYKIFPDTTSTNLCPDASTSDEVIAINDAVSHGASVISLSLGSGESGGTDTGEQNAIANAIAHNVTVVAAAGNEYGTGSDGNVPDYPGAYPGVIAVGASAVTDDNTGASYGAIIAETIASYSNSGATLVAPGGDALGSSDQDTLHWIEGFFTRTSGDPSFQCSNTSSTGVCAAYFNGTSQATPQVAGAVALMEAYHGGARSLSPATVKTLLTNNADVLSGISSTRQGAGRLNAAKAVAAAHP